MTPNLIIFDCDGVLVDTEPVTDALISESLSAHGLSIMPGEIHALFTGGTMECVAIEARMRGADLPSDWIDQIYSAMFARLEQGVELIPGVLEFIDAAERAGIAMAVASNAPKAKMRRSLGSSGLWGRFSPAIYSRDDHAAKPAPDMILHAMTRAGTLAAQTVFVDDSPTGCRAGVAAGVRTFGLSLTGQDAALADVGAEVVGSFVEIARSLDLDMAGGGAVS